MTNNYILVTAHRGSSDSAPENTLSAINLAVHQQADYIEIDIQQTKDGSLVVLHDSNLQRVAGVDCNIWELTDAQVSELDVGSWFSSEFAGEKVPFLESVIQLVKGKVKLNIELKLNGHQQNLAEKIINLVNQQNFIHNCILTSFDYNILLQVKELNPNITTGLITAKTRENIFDLKVNLYSVEQKLATIDFINAAHAQGREVHVWTVNDIAEMEKLIARGVDNIITNKPKTLRNLLRQLGRDTEVD